MALFAEPSYTTCVIASEKPPLKLLKKQLSTKQQKLPNARLGRHGEQQAALYFQNLDFQVLATNVLVPNLGELDLVLLSPTGKELVFVEVKTRTSPSYGDGEHAVNYKKLRALQRTARAYCRQKHWRGTYRFDLVTIVAGKLEHFENITW